MLEPSWEEAAARRQSIQHVTHVVHSIWPAAEVKVFGSYETGAWMSWQSTGQRHGVGGDRRGSVWLGNRVQLVPVVLGCQTPSSLLGSPLLPPGLYVPTSDIDIVIMGTGANNVALALRALGNALQQRGLVRNLQVNPRACGASHA